MLSEGARSEEAIRVGYFVTRAALAQQVTAAAEILTKGTTLVTSSAITRLISNIASATWRRCFGKGRRPSDPNRRRHRRRPHQCEFFVDHFQNTADAHFTVRAASSGNLGVDLVKREYERIARGGVERLTQG